MANLTLLHHAIVLGSSATVAYLAHAVASTPARAAERLGVRGMKRTRARDSMLFGMVEPFVRWFATRLSGLVPEKLYRALDRQLVLSGDYLGLTPEEYVAITLIGTMAGAFAGWLYAVNGGAPLGIVIFGVAGMLSGYMLVGREVERRARQLSRGLPYVIDLLALAMSAGLDLPGSIRQVVTRSSDKRDALTEELERLLQELSLGRTRREVLQDFADRTNVTAVTEFVAAVLQAEQRGNPLAETLMIQAQVSRQRRTTQAEEATARSATLVYLPLALLMLAVLLLVGGPLALKMMTTLGD